MSSLQKVLLDTYHMAWTRRSKTMDGVTRALYELEQSRLAADVAQRWLERVGAELKASGYDKADDYLERVWPTKKPDEYVHNPNAATYD